LEIIRRDFIIATCCVYIKENVMTDAGAAIISSCIAGLVAVVISILSSRSQIKELEKRLQNDQNLEKEKERKKKRIEYFDPLIVYATDLLDKIKLLQKELVEKESFWVGTFNEVKHKDRNNKQDFAFWCNGYGAGAVTTLYVTVVYFACVGKIRSELPFVQLRENDDQLLLTHITDVRNAFGGENNLWVEMQDSLGNYVTDANDRILNYKDFCNKIIDPWEHIWFIRLLDFYREIHLKRLNELPRIVSTLEKLIAFAKDAS
jgi:hypothetical protein